MYTKKCHVDAQNVVSVDFKPTDQCCGSGQFFESGSGSADPVLNSPDPGDPKKTGSDRIKILLRYVLDV